MPDLSDLAPILAAALFGGLFAFHNAPKPSSEPAQSTSEIVTTAKASPQR